METRNVGMSMLIPLVVGSLFSTVAQAQSGTVRLYAGLAPTTYQISFDQNAPNFSGGINYKNKTAKSNYTAVNLGLTWVSPKGIYVDLSGQQSGSATHDFWTDTTSTPQNFSHDSYTLTGGYSHAFPQGISVSGFGGFINGSTVLNAPSPPFGFTKDKFDSKGIFLGVGVGYPALGGQFSGSVAVAGMNGKWTDDVSYNNHADNTVGFSLGAGYTYKFTPAWGITGDFRFQRYNYNFAVYSATQPAYQVSEKIASAGVKVSYQF